MVDPADGRKKIRLEVFVEEDEEEGGEQHQQDQGASHRQVCQINPSTWPNHTFAGLHFSNTLLNIWSCSKQINLCHCIYEEKSMQLLVKESIFCGIFGPLN